MTRSLIPVLTVTALLIALWYAAVVPMNAQWERDQAARGGYTLTTAELVARAMEQERPRLPAPHQIAVELWNSTFGCGAVSPRVCRATTAPDEADLAERLTFARERVVASAASNRSLIWHGWITLSATALGFAIGTALGLALAIGIVHSRVMDASVMPWAIASQTIPIIALAPMIIVVLSSVGITGLVPKSIIAAYLSFFPVAVGMVKGLRAPDAIQLDQMKTWNASGLRTFLHLRLPASQPYLFASLKIAAAAAVVGTIVGELPVQQGGLGTRLLSGSYYGQTVQIWAALFAGAGLAAVLVGVVGLIQRLVMTRLEYGLWLGWAVGAVALILLWRSGAGTGLALPDLSPLTDPRLLTLLAVWLGAWGLNVALVAWMGGRPARWVAPTLFGVTLLLLWELACRLYEVPRVILPPPSMIAARLVGATDVLWIDLVQTVGKGALSGFAIGCGAAILFALVVDRFDFLRRGLLPVGNFLAALPIVGTAPIMVMWFGFDWPSKAAVVVAMVFFPMLVNTVQGLAASEPMQRDLMRTWSGTWWQTLVYLRAPAAMPFVFNGLKICATLSLIGAIVAEFFGSPTRGMGFRISTEVGRLQLDMVWAEIAVAALAGSAFYGIWALLERRVTHWHPSQRGR